MPRKTRVTRRRQPQRWGAILKEAQPKFPVCPRCKQACLVRNKRRPGELKCPVCWSKYDMKAVVEENRFERIRDVSEG